jgi:hypothetical protein
MLDLSERAQDKRPVVPLNVRGPASLDVRLDQLCNSLDLANHARPSRDLLVAALVFAAPIDPEKLEEILMAYRGATHSEVLIGDYSGELDVTALKESVAARAK